MTEARRRAYLDALGFDVWVTKPPDPEWDRLAVGPGQGSTLLVCSTPDEGSSPLSGDIARALGGDPVWAWPDPEGKPESPRLEEAVRDRLFTRVFIFGRDVAERLLGSEVPAVVVSSAVSVAPGLGELAVRGTAKRQLWGLVIQELRTAGKGHSA